MKKKCLSVGDFIIDSDKIYIITKIDNDKVFYQSVDQTQHHDNCTCSIPLKNLSIACVRPLLTASEIKILLKNLSCGEPLKLPFVSKNPINNSNFFKDILYSNDPIQTGKLLVYLFQVETDFKLSRTDQMIYDQALAHLANEISFVDKIPFNLAKARIIKALKK